MDDLNTPASGLLAHSDAAFLLALRITGNNADAEDVVQEAYLRALRFSSSPSGKGAGSGGAMIPAGAEQRKWFLRVVANVAKDFRSASASRLAREKQAMSDETLTRGATAVREENALRDAIAEALASLDESLRVPVSLHYEQGLSYAEASDVLGVPEGTLRKYASRGIEALRERLAGRGHSVATSVIASALAGGMGVKAPAALTASVKGMLTAGASKLGPGAAVKAAGIGWALKCAIAAVVLTVGAVTVTQIRGGKSAETGAGEKGEQGAPASLAADPTHLKAVASIWLSAMPGETDTSCGNGERFKLKSVQELAALRFENGPMKGREVVKARLFMKPNGDVQLRYIRLSTVNQDWEAGNAAKEYSPGDGATFDYADAASKRPWSFGGSQFSDVIMTNGNTLASWNEIHKEADGWVSVDVAPALVYALANGDTDGLAVMEGGTILLTNNFIYSAQAKGNEPYLQIEYGAELKETPARPSLRVLEPVGHVHADTTAVAFALDDVKNVFCWRLALNGKPVERWRVKHPGAGTTEMVLDGLPAGQPCELEITAVSRGGQVSQATKAKIAPPPLLKTPKLEALAAPQASAMKPPEVEGRLRAWAYPPVLKLSPEKTALMCNDEHSAVNLSQCNAVWDGKQVRIAGCQGEYVSFQLCVENLGATALIGAKLSASELRGGNGAVIPATDVELFKNWYAQNSDKQWQPAYCAPYVSGAQFQIPDPARTGLNTQTNQSFYVDIYVPKLAAPGEYTGTVAVQAPNSGALTLPVTLAVYDFALPDELAFRPELNTYGSASLANYQLAQRHRCTLNARDKHQPVKLEGSGKSIRVKWTEYDRVLGELISGEAFANGRRAGVPIECLYLPYHDNWPTILTEQTYNYHGHWAKKGDGNELIHEHAMTAPYLGDALSQDYKDAFVAVEKQFIEHFQAHGWTQTEMQMLFDSKDYHRLDFGTNDWFTTDEPYHWNDWLSVQFFCKLWSDHRGSADPNRWPARADISRPQWQGRVLDGIVNTVYFGTGGFSSPPMFHRCKELAEAAHLKPNCYGSANADNLSNTRTIAVMLNCWENGGEAFLPWQSLGGPAALDVNDPPGNGSALMAPGVRVGATVLADIRLKALRDGEQLIEYLDLAARRNGLKREQMQTIVQQLMPHAVGVKKGANADNADALQAGSIEAWQLAALRQRIAEWIVKGETPEVRTAQLARLKSGTASEKIAALRSVAQTRNPELLQAIVDLRQDAAPLVSIEAGKALLARCDERGVAPLLQLIESKDLSVATAAYWPLKEYVATVAGFQAHGERNTGVDAEVVKAIRAFEKERDEAVKQEAAQPPAGEGVARDF